jgi:antitoxin YefM
MKTTSCTEFRARYAEVLDGVINDREEVVINRAGHESVVIASTQVRIASCRYHYGC